MDFAIDNIKVICDVWMARNVDISALEKFAALKSNDNRFSFVMNIFQQKDPKIFIQDIGKKSLIAQDFRNAGNKKFGEKKYKESNQLYTKSLAFAPKDSQERILALGNRAATSLHLGYIPEALVDVQRALEMPNIAEDYKLKLEKRKEECMNRIIESKEPFKLPQVPKINKKSNYFDCASDKIIMSHSDEMGRFLSAGEDIVTGELLAIEKPYSSVMMPDMYYSHCSYCFLPYPALIDCEHCTCALYCSTQCLNNDKMSHKYMCNILERVTFIKMEQICLLSMKILIVAACEGINFKDLHKTAIDDSYRSLDFQRCFELIGNTEHRSPIDLFKRSFKACTIVEALKKFTSFFEDYDVSEKRAGGLLLHLHQSMPCNAHAIYNTGVQEVGAGAYAALSLLNHSCDPNVVRQYVGSTSILRAIRPIKKGQQIFDDYGYIYAMHDRAKRRAEILKCYFFDCQCEACVRNWPLYSELSKDQPIFVTADPRILLKLEDGDKTFNVILNKVIANKHSEDMLPVVCEYLDVLDSAIERPWRVFNDAQEAFKHLLDFYPTFQR